MNLLLYGQDSFRSRQKLEQILAKYQSTYGTNSLVILLAENLTFEDFARQAQSQPLFAQKRLLVIKNLLSQDDKTLQKKILETLDKLPDTTLLVFYETETYDKKNPLFQKLHQKGFYQEFLPLQGIFLKNWIKNYVTKEEGQITAEALEELVINLGSDLFQMKNELDKLLSFDPQITSQTVKLLVHPKISSDIFGLIDALAKKNQKLSFQKLHNLILNGEDEFYIFSMIIYQFRNLLIVKDLLEKYRVSSVEVSGYREIAKRAGLHPFVLQKTLVPAKNFALTDLTQIYQLLLNFDFEIKTGKIEIKAALDLLVGKLTIKGGNFVYLSRSN